MLIGVTVFSLESVLGFSDKAFMSKAGLTLSCKKDVLFQVKHMDYDDVK